MTDNITNNDEPRKPEYTKGPWRFEVNQKSKQINLCGGNPCDGFGKYDLTVMDFVRWGMGGAAPRFRDGENLLTRADELSVTADGREHHSDWFQRLRHPDAQLIEAAPDLLEALQEAEGFVDRHSEDWYTSGQDLLKKMRAAIAKALGQ